MHLQKTKPVALQSFLITSSFLMGALIQQYLIMGQNFVIRYVHTHILKITSVGDTHRSVTLALKHTYIQSLTTSLMSWMVRTTIPVLLSFLTLLKVPNATELNKLGI